MSERYHLGSYSVPHLVGDRAVLVRVRVPGDGMLHPACLSALALLGINDWWLKSAYPGAITGKLSDFAGLFFFPILLFALLEITRHLLRRPWLASVSELRLSCVLTGAVFAAINSSGACAASYVHFMRGLWGFVLQTSMISINHTLDPSDLVALLALFPAYRLQLNRLK